MFLKHWRTSTICLAVSLAGALIFVGAFGAMRFNFQAFDFRLGLNFSHQGNTEIVLPPLGSIVARTHVPPLRITLALENIDLEKLRLLLDRAPTKEVFLTEARTAGRRLLWRYLIHLLVVGSVGGAFALLLIKPQRARCYLGGALVGAGLVLGIVLGVYGSYNVQEFNNPKLTGTLKVTPWAIGLAEEALDRVDTLGQELELVAGRLYDLLGRIDRMDPLLSAGNLRVLHVSDIHNNPAAYDFIEQIVRSFGVDLVIDTGDITDYGTPLETGLTRRLADFPVPYLFIPGNHDSPAIIDELSEYPNVQVLDNRMVSIYGLNIAGVTDPSSRSEEIAPVSQGEMEAEGKKLAEILDQSGAIPDLVAAHNRLSVEQFIGRVPLILHGHGHKLMINIRSTTVVIDAGTSGGAGIRGLAAGKPIPYSVVLIYLEKGTGGRWHLTATDSIQVYKPGSGFTLERKFY